MKTRLLAFALLLCTTFAAKAQYVTIPDANFVTWLQTNYPNCMQGNQMDTTCSAIVSAINVDVSNKSISNLSGIHYFDGLRNLTCRNNLLTSLPLLPGILNFLDCTNNSITSLPPLPGSLQYLYCSSNNIQNLGALPSGLVMLNVSNNEISYLPNLPTSLGQIDCYSNYLTELPLLPASLMVLNWR